MKNIRIHTASTSLLSGLLLIAGCSGGGSDGGTTGAAVPANAVVIDAVNAESTVASSVTTVDALDALDSLTLAVESTPATIGLKDALALIKPRVNSIKSSLSNSGADLVYGVATSGSGACGTGSVGGGTYSFSGDSSGTSPSFTDSFSVTLVNCDEGSGFIINGTFTGVSSWNEVTGAYSDTFTGSLSIEGTGAPTFKFSFNGLDYAETGNDLIPGAETYTVTKATYSLDLTGGGGFLVGLTAPIVESNGGFNSCPESGAVLITGANGTTAEGIYNGDTIVGDPTSGTMTIKANGAVVAAAATCYY